MERVRGMGPARRAVVIAISTVILVVGGAGPALAPAAGAAAPYCGITWGSLPKSNPRMVRGPLVNIRAGQHPCYDRLVVDLSRGPAPGWSVRYVSHVVSDGSGRTIPLRGGAFLQIAVRAPAVDSAGHPTYRPARRSECVSVSGFRTFRQVAFDGSFEGITTIGLGVRARLPMRVFVLSGPGSGARLVIDVAHRWT